MKKAIILCMLIIWMVADAQNQITTKPLQLNTVNKGFASDSVLVWGKDKIVKFVPKSSFRAGSSTHITAGYNITINGSGDINNPYIINSSYPTNGASYSDNPFTAYCFIYPDRGFQYYKKESQSNEGRSAQTTYSDSSINYWLEGNATWPQSNNSQLELKFPKPISGYNTHTLPISVNGNFADSSGNIEISEGGDQVPNLSQVLISGSTDRTGQLLKFESPNTGYIDSAFMLYNGIHVYGANNATQVFNDGISFSNEISDSFITNVRLKGSPTKDNTKTSTYRFPDKVNGEYTLASTDDLGTMVTTNGTVTGTQTFKLESNDHITSTYMKNNEIGSQSSSGKVYLRNNALSFLSGGSCIQLSKSSTQRSSTQIFVTMPDNNGQLALRDEFAYDSSATTAISATNLNSDFTNVPNGFKVRTQIVDPSDTSKFIMYEKTSTGWIEYSFKKVTP
ncbi:hypothetical protein [[Flexibacter] sp. ATCC 35103]|uniref:hypothetical protein n=1 Tax=[Flexibacter] sp. ATCC 35103 TaxID=1937528 RepID=UPI000F4F8BFA|nr:hypothetical protein [[Flexibacter] sp. ATCC 35103]